MRMILRSILPVLVCIGICSLSVAEPRKKDNRRNKRVEKTETKKDTIVRSEAIPAIADFVKTAAEKYPGLVNIYVKGNKYYAEIPDTLFGRDLAVMISLIKGSAQKERSPKQMFGFPGDALSLTVLQFEKGPHEQVFITEPFYSSVQKDTTSDFYRLQQKTEFTPISMVFDVKAKGDHAVLIDLTDAISGDNEIFSLKSSKDQLLLGAFQSDKSYITGVSNFDNQVIFRSVKSYGAGSPPKGEKRVMNPTRWEIGACMYLLPDQPMRPRYMDTRVGYFASRFLDHSKNPYTSEQVLIASRWRIEPRPEDVEKYKKGELVEPAKPIVFYIDPNTPRYLVPYLIEGVEEWQKAFERAGFKNAIQARLMPDANEDPAFLPENLQYSIISYKLSPMQNAYGPHMADPRSGEILSSHIAIFHSVQRLVQGWYFSQAGAVDARARLNPFPQELMGRLMKYIICHEVGHTLGLRHNFAGSCKYTIAQLRDKDYVKQHGHSASIMDYARFNYVAQPEDQLDTEDLIPGLGEYDLFAIEWGYRYFPELENAEQERDSLQRWTTRQRHLHPRLEFGPEMNPSEPRFQSEDLGDNNMQANEYGIKNLKRIMANLENWTPGDDETYTMLKERYQAVRTQYIRYLMHAVQNVGGHFAYDLLRSEGGKSLVAVSRQQQKEAMVFLKRHVFTVPAWLYPPRYCRIAGLQPELAARTLQKNVLTALMAKFTDVDKNQQLAGTDTYQVKEFADDLYALAFPARCYSQLLDPVQRSLQTQYVRLVQAGVDGKLAEMPDAAALMFSQLEKIRVQAQKAAASTSDQVMQAHWDILAKRIDAWMTGEKKGLLK